jgi:hypothetical protein
MAFHESLEAAPVKTVTTCPEFLTNFPAAKLISTNDTNWSAGMFRAANFGKYERTLREVKASVNRDTRGFVDLSRIK